MTHLGRLSATVFGLAFLTSQAAAESSAIKAMQDYMELSKDIFDSIVFIDTRDAAQFATGSILGARNIEWREVLSRIDEIPKAKKVILFCNTGSLSAQAAFALRVAGRDNGVLLQTGLDGWKKDAAYKP